MPPRVAFAWGQHGAFGPLSFIPCLLRSHVEFAMNFLTVVVFAKLLQQRVGRLDFSNVFSPEKSWKTVFPKVMEALDLAFFLGRSGILKAHAIKPQGCVSADIESR